MIMLVQCPIEPFNLYVRDGSVGAIFVVDVNDAADVTGLAEPWFLSFSAEVEFRIAMAAQELGGAGLVALGKQF
jgi:hypothetical protein